MNGKKPEDNVVEFEAMDVIEWEAGQHTPVADAKLVELVRKTSAHQAQPELEAKPPRATMKTMIRTKKDGQSPTQRTAPRALAATSSADTPRIDETAPRTSPPRTPPAGLPIASSTGKAGERGALKNPEETQVPLAAPPSATDLADMSIHDISTKVRRPDEVALELDTGVRNAEWEAPEGHALPPPRVEPEPATIPRSPWAQPTATPTPSLPATLLAPPPNRRAADHSDILPRNDSSDMLHDAQPGDSLVSPFARLGRYRRVIAIAGASAAVIAIMAFALTRGSSSASRPPTPPAKTVAEVAAPAVLVADPSPAATIAKPKPAVAPVPPPPRIEPAKAKAKAKKIDGKRVVVESPSRPATAAPHRPATRRVATRRAAPPPPPATAPVDAADEAALARARDAYAAGNQKLFAGDTDGAIESYRESLADDPGYVAGYRGLGLAYAQQGDHPKAIQALRKYLNAAPTAKDAPLIRKRLAMLKH